GFDITFTATPTVIGAFANPRGGGTEKVDPNSNITESDETNNTANNSVTVTAPDLTLAISNNVGGAVLLGNSWTWTLHVANAGNAAATFASSQTIVLDNLPNSNISYGAVSFSNQSGISGTGSLSGSISSSDLSITASAGTVIIGAGGSFDITFT